MYLVELRPGKEELYRNGDDLALAIRVGDVDAGSRIYHRATARWISITLHPQYKAIVAGETDVPVERLPRRGWAGVLQAALSGQTADTTVPEEASEESDILRHWKQPLWLGLTSVLLVLGIQLASSGPRPPWSEGNNAAVVSGAQAERAEKVAPDRLERLSADRDSEEGLAAMEHEANLVSLASTDESAMDLHPGLETAASPAPKKAPMLPRAPRLRSKALRAALAAGDAGMKPAKAHSVEAILRSYESASDSVHARLAAGLRVARLNRLFATSRLTPGGGVAHTRLSLAGAVNIIRVFRMQQAAVDSAYQDSVASQAKQHGWTPKEVRLWYSRPQRKETPALELVSGTLIASIDSVLGVLDEQAGAYKIRGTAIAFEDPTAAKEYAAVRARIKEQIASAIAAGGATSPGPTALLLRAIGTSTLPRET
ncbi:MAG TPA: hypothetical protein VFS51_04725 [Gemmatimonadales bacterium]|nr:hypothetical protein [Gemmatimonadales bacterium]